MSSHLPTGSGKPSYFVKPMGEVSSDVLCCVELLPTFMRRIQYNTLVLTMQSRL
jgi:hypothetical protein